MGRNMMAMAAFLAAAGPAGAVGLLGQTATGALSGSITLENRTQFNSPRVLGDGIDFTGGFSSGPSFQRTDWIVDVDFIDTGFTMAILSPPTQSATRMGLTTDTALRLSFAGLSGVRSVSLASYTCAMNLFSCQSDLFPVGQPVLTQLQWSPTTVTMAVNGLRMGEVYAFNVQTGVPEPATWATMIIGFGVAGAVMRRRRPVDA